MATVLIVDDEPHIRAFYRAALERHGYEIREARDGADALEMVREQPVDLVVADVVMPRMGGRELVWTLSQTTPETPVILISGLLAADHMDHLDVQPAAYLVKPVDTSELVNAVASLLG